MVDLDLCRDFGEEVRGLGRSEMSTLISSDQKKGLRRGRELEDHFSYQAKRLHNTAWHLVEK